MADVAERGHVGAAAQLDRVRPRFQHPHHIAVLVAEEGNGADRLRVAHRRLVVTAAAVGDDLGIRDALNLAQLRGTHAFVVAEVESQPIGRHQRAGLLDVMAEHLAQRPVQDVRAGVIAADGAAPLVVDLGADQRAGLDDAAVDAPDVAVQICQRVRAVEHVDDALGACDRADVADLPAALCVERSAIQEHLDEAVAFDCSVQRAIVRVPACLARRGLGRELEDGQDPGVISTRRIPHEVGRPELGQQLAVALIGEGGPAGPARSRPGTLLFHGDLEALAVEAEAAFREDLLGHLDREAVRVVEQECDLAVEHCRIEHSGRLVEDLLPGSERGPEALLLAGHHLGDELLVDDQVGVVVAHHLHHDLDQPRHHDIGDAEHPGMANRAADDAPQHVAAVLVGGEDAVGDEHGRRAGVVGEDPHRDIGLGIGAVGLAADALGFGQQRHEEVDVPCRRNALQHGQDAFEAGAGVDAGCLQRCQLAGAVGRELHEHQVPDFDEAILVSVGGTAAGAVFGTEVVEDLAAGPARADVAGSPPVVLVEPLDAFGRDADGCLPDLGGLVVRDVDGHPQLVGVEAEHLGHELPRPRDRLGLEVVAEAEVAHHLEEREVAIGAADVVEVVVLAARPDALLDGHHAACGGHLGAEEVRHERHHAGHREQQRRLVGNQARGGADFVSSLGPERAERLTQFPSAHRSKDSYGPSRPPWPPRPFAAS